MNDLNAIDKNVAFNTLFALARPDLNKLAKKHAPVERTTHLWQKSALKGYGDSLVVVWIPKKYEWTGDSAAEAHYVGSIEAHFVGTPQDCLSFTQKNHVLPMYACSVKSDMSGILDNTSETTHSKKLDPSWLLTNDLQLAISDEVIDSLPIWQFILDPQQERVIELKPPLLLESRSGTGKTNCLFR